MKRITLLMALLCAVTLFGQQRIPAHVQQLINNKTIFRPVSPLSVSATRNAKADAVVTEATYASLNTAVIKDIAKNKYAAIELSIPYNNSTVTMQLYRVEVTANGFHIDTDKKQNIAYAGGAYYRGIVKGDPKSVAAFSFFDKEMAGVASSEQLHNLVVGRLRTADNFSNYIVYSDKNMTVANNFVCNTEDNNVVPGFMPHGKSVQEVESTRCVTVYFEIRYKLFEQNNYDTTLTSNWLTAMFNNVQTLYDNDGITTAIKSVYIWTEPDTYDATSSGDYLMQFYYTRPVFDGDVGQLMGVDDGGLGGVAISIDGLCTDMNVSYADTYLSYETVPVFSWTIEVVTHELGHLYGSPHTHGCYWNGNDTAIDGCGTSVGYVEGTCEEGYIPSAEEGGTIMSYCHLVNGVGINFANGFGPQPAQRILDNIANSQCLSTDCINTCINTVTALYVMDSSMTTATLQWEDGNSGPWQVGYAPLGEDITSWTEVTTTSYTIEGLDADSYYTFSVRPMCNETQIPADTGITFGTEADDWCNGASWTDTGGILEDYPNKQHLVRIIKPGVAGNNIQVSFDSFELENDYDFMYVYDGIGTTAPLLGSFTGSDIPGPFEATNADGALTFEFISDEYLTRSGWEATVNCTLGTQENTFSNLSYYPNPVNGNLTITASEGITHIAIYNIAGQLLAERQLNATTSVTDMSGYATGVYFIKVDNGRNTANLKVVKE
ncbi:T9SS type A sorting domain-containing protein [Flavobacterium sp. RHBU_3]|uniref:T9SS type A sorting domain-containing protein n=1 Tax=Flavobacterium sp. RHBU_3 TaxID=3391184 RepID=UPI0039851B14